MSTTAIEYSLTIPTTASTLTHAISTTSAQSAAINRSGPQAGNMVPVVIYATVACFVRRGVNPTAAADGTDMAIPPLTLLRTRVYTGEKIAVITATGTGTFSITPDV
jgi:hypothetical protein